MGNFWILLAAPAAVLAAWLFLSVYSEQKQDLNTTKFEQRRDRAEFDRDFDEAWKGRASKTLEARAADAAGDLAKAEVERKALEVKRQAEQAEEERQLRELLQARVSGAEGSNK